MSKTWSKIRYRDFWDVPRIFVTEHGGQWFLFDCAFDEATEDYPESYRVALIKPPTEDVLAASWKKLPGLTIRTLGEIAIDKVEFDESKRQAINASVLDELAAANHAKRPQGGKELVA